MVLPVFIVLLIVSLYTLAIFCFALKLYRLKAPANRDAETMDPDAMEPEISSKVSILIPFKNERRTLPYLVNDLLEQTYPAEKMDILFINDHSEDGSRVIFESVSSKQTTFSCLDLPDGKHGKKEALAHGIEQAATKWIIQIDADCRIGPGFVASHMAFLERNPSDLVAGLVTTDEGRGGFLEQFERLDQISLAGVGAASFQLGRAMMCSGANLVYSKELYFNTRVYDPSRQLASGDDMFLMIGARKLDKTLSFNLDRDSVVRTTPVLTMRSFLDQRIRWGAKSTHYKMPDIQLLAILVALTNVFLLLYPLGLVLYPEIWWCFLGSWMAKTGADFMLLYRVSAYTKQRKSMKFFLPVAIVYYPLYLVIIISLIFRKPSWESKRIS
ncbi:MAG: glycosyltransferase [Bacteroidota bacterium]